MSLQNLPLLPHEETAPKGAAETPEVTLRPRCYCTAMDRRARFMHAGFQETDCDGSMCATRRAEAEATAAFH